MRFLVCHSRSCGFFDFCPIVLPVLAAGSPETLRDLIDRTRKHPHIGWRVDAVCTAGGMGNAVGELDGIPVDPNRQRNLTEETAASA